MKISHILLFSMTVLLLSGCAVKLPSNGLNRLSASQAAIDFYLHLDKQLKKDRINPLLGNKIAGFPYLRTNRFLTHLKRGLDSDQQKKQWAAHLQAYDIAARTSEIKALPEPSIRLLINTMGLPGNTTRQDLTDLLTQYANQLRTVDEKDPSYIDTLIKNVNSPDEYSTALRVIGFYPLAYGPVACLTRKTYEKMNQQHLTPPDQLPVNGQQVQYLPETRDGPETEMIKDMFTQTPSDSLGIQKFGHDQLSQLLTVFAPVYLQDQVDSNDIPGTIQTDGKTVFLDLKKPAVYYYFSHAILNQRPVFQINYVIWFSARKGPDVPWYEQGAIDGFTYRVTLDASGTPFMIDIMHNCGCYHFFVPDKSVVKTLKPAATEFGNQVPTWMPDTSGRKRISLTVSSGKHMIDHVGLQTVSHNTRTYRLLAYSDLEALNIFDDNAVVKGSRRLEPLFLFPMGVSDVGAMRQRTHHPTRLLGRQHFDNPLLLEHYFEFDFKNR